MSNISDRLKELVGDGSVNSCAKRWGISGTGLRSYLEGSIPSADKAARIAERAGVSLVWLISGSGPKTAQSEGFSESQAPYLAGPDPELLGRIVDVIFEVHAEGGVRLPNVEIGRMAAEKYSEIAREAVDRDEWPALLDLLAVRLRRSLRAAAARPTDTERET